MASNFYIHLSSVDSLLYYPYNTSHKFTNLLSSSISLSEGAYEVALASLVYGQKALPNSPIKLNLGSESKIMINYPSKSYFSKEFNVADLYLGTTHVINLINDELKKLRYAHLVEYSENKTKKIKLYVYVPKNGRIELDEKVAKLLGFKRNSFKNGEHIPSEEMDLEVIRLMDKPVKFTLVKLVNIFARLPEPVDETADSIAESLTKAFESKGIDVSALADENEENIKFTIEDEQLSFYLPIGLSNCFHLDPEQQYSQDYNSFSALALKQVNNSCQILCTSNIVQEQHFGSQMSPLLRVIPVANSINTSNAINFDPLFYVPVTVKHLSDIQIEFKTSNNSELPIDFSPLILTLHFRKQ